MPKGTMILKCAMCGKTLVLEDVETTKWLDETFPWFEGKRSMSKQGFYFRDMYILQQRRGAGSSLYCENCMAGATEIERGVLNVINHYFKTGVIDWGKVEVLPEAPKE